MGRGVIVTPAREVDGEKGLVRWKRTLVGERLPSSLVGGRERGPGSGKKGKNSAKGGLGRRPRIAGARVSLDIVRTASTSKAKGFGKRAGGSESVQGTGEFGH